MRSNEVFPGRYLTAADLGGTRPVVTIAEVRSEEIGGEVKRVAYFVGKTKGLALNRTNWLSISEAIGLDDDEQWTGHAIRLVTSRVTYLGKPVDAVRVERVSAPPAPPPPVAPPRAPGPAAMPAADDVPF
jgi:hypothetical protein